MSFRKPCHMPFHKVIPPFTLTVYNSMTLSQKSSQPVASEHYFGATGHALIFGGKLAD